jgi:Ca2+-binding EF-hand superfamily protein
MKLYDTDGDGHLDPAELTPHLVEPSDFRVLDLDGDGRVAPRELRQGLWEQPTRLEWRSD